MKTLAGILERETKNPHNDNGSKGNGRWPAGANQTSTILETGILRRAMPNSEVGLETSVWTSSSCSEVSISPEATSSNADSNTQKESCSKRSREKRRLENIAMEQQLLDLKRENEALKRQLGTRRKDRDEIQHKGSVITLGPNSRIQEDFFGPIPSIPAASFHQQTISSSPSTSQLKSTSFDPMQTIPIQSATGSAFSSLKNFALKHDSSETNETIGSLLNTANNNRLTSATNTNFSSYQQQRNNASSGDLVQNYILRMFLNQNCGEFSVNQLQEVKNIMALKQTNFSGLQQQNSPVNKLFDNQLLLHPNYCTLEKNEDIEDYSLNTHNDSLLNFRGHSEPKYKQMKTLVNQDLRPQISSPPLPDSSSDKDHHKHVDSFTPIQSSPIFGHFSSNVIRSTTHVENGDSSIHHSSSRNFQNMSSSQENASISTIQKNSSLFECNNKNVQLSGFFPLELGVIKRTDVEAKKILPRDHKRELTSGLNLQQKQNPSTSTSVLSSILEETRKSPTQSSSTAQEGISKSVEMNSADKNANSEDSLEHSPMDSSLSSSSPSSSLRENNQCYIQRHTSSPSHSSDRDENITYIRNSNDGNDDRECPSFEPDAYGPPESKGQAAYERYIDRRRRNNEAAKRCRANRRVAFEQRSKKVLMLEAENAELRQEMLKLNSELEQLKTIILTNNRLLPAL